MKNLILKGAPDKVLEILIGLCVCFDEKITIKELLEVSKCQ